MPRFSQLFVPVCELYKSRCDSFKNRLRSRSLPRCLGRELINMLACRVGWFAARALGRGARHEKPRSPSIAVVFFEGRRRTADRGLRSVVARARFLRCPGLCCRLPALCCRYPAHSGPALEMSPGVVLLARSPLPLGAACSASRVVRTAVELASAVGPTALLLGRLGGCADCGL